jgi:hypothetical protein
MCVAVIAEKVVKKGERKEIRKGNKRELLTEVDFAEGATPDFAAELELAADDAVHPSRQRAR